MNGILLKLLALKCLWVEVPLSTSSFDTCFSNAWGLYEITCWCFIWVILSIRVPLRVRFIRVPYYIGDPKMDP